MKYMVFLSMESDVFLVILEIGKSGNKLLIMPPLITPLNPNQPILATHVLDTSVGLCLIPSLPVGRVMES